MFPERSGEGGRPHVQGRARREREEEEEGNLEAEPIHDASRQSAERQLPQYLKGGQEAVVGRLMERGGEEAGCEGEVKWESSRESNKAAVKMYNDFMKIEGHSSEKIRKIALSECLITRIIQFK